MQLFCAFNSNKIRITLRKVKRNDSRCQKNKQAKKGKKKKNILNKGGGTC